MLDALAEDLKQRGDLDLSECFIDGTFVVAKILFYSVSEILPAPFPAALIEDLWPFL